MALDVTILAANGEPESTVPVHVNAHARLIGIADDATFPLVSRLRNYYQDAEYEVQELQDLKAELSSIRALVQGDDELVGVVSKLVDLVLSAIKLGRPVLAIAD
jgi:hypothetical protein